MEIKRMDTKEQKPLKNKEITIGVMSNGWEIKVGNKSYTGSINDDKFGMEALEVLFSDLGAKVKIEEWY